LHLPENTFKKKLLFLIGMAGIMLSCTSEKEYPVNKTKPDQSLETYVRLRHHLSRIFAGVKQMQNLNNLIFSMSPDIHKN